MIKENCLYYEKFKDMGATIDWCHNYPHLDFDCEKCEKYIKKDFVRVVRCKDCKFYAEDEKWCKRLNLIGSFNENDFCSHGELDVLSYTLLKTDEEGEEDGNNNNNYNSTH